MDLCSIYLPWSARINGSWTRFLSVGMCHLVKNPFDCVEHVILCSDAEEAPPFWGFLTCSTHFSHETKKPLTASWSQLDLRKETFPALSFQLWKTGNSHDTDGAVILICKDSEKLLMVNKKKITDYDMIGTWRWNQREMVELGFIVEKITKSLFPVLQIIRVETQKYQWPNQEEIILKLGSEWLFI